jgi:hypothetical protein
MRGKIIKVETSRDMMSLSTILYMAVSIPETSLDTNSFQFKTDFNIGIDFITDPFSPEVFGMDELLDIQQRCAQEIARRMTEED